MSGSCHCDEEPDNAGVLKPMTILIIEDNSADRSAYRRFLELTGGYVVCEAEDGKAGLDMASQLRPDCILLQLKLKDESGLEVLVKLLEETATTAIPVIMISSDVAKVVVDAALSFGASHFLIKGKFDAAALDAAIRESVTKPTNQ